MSKRMDLNLRNVPPELMRKLKIVAAEKNLTLKKLCFEVLSSYCDSHTFTGFGEVPQKNRSRDG